MAELIEQTDDRLVIRKLIPASREEVFAAWSDPEGMGRWMCPGDVKAAEAQVDFRVGGSFRILMKGEGQDYDHTGVYQVIEPPSKLTFTWISKGTDLKTTLVTVELREHEGGTELMLTHERFPSSGPVQQHASGWGRIADLLAAYFERGKTRPHVKT
jgi:uncharacterized protein YndB with AHSA1/START domain